MTKSRTANAIELFDTIDLLPVALNKKWRKKTGNSNCHDFHWC